MINRIQLLKFNVDFLSCSHSEFYPKKQPTSNLNSNLCVTCEFYLNSLESYCFNMKSTIEDEKLKDKIEETDRKVIMDKCNDAIAWLDANQTAEVDEFKDKQKEVEAVCNPIITKLYQAAGGAPGGMPGGMFSRITGCLSSNCVF